MNVTQQVELLRVDNFDIFMTLNAIDEVNMFGFELQITNDKIGFEFRHIVENVDMIICVVFQTLSK